MTDQILRELERRFLETGAQSDDVAYLRERVRVGELSEERLTCWAYFGDLAAQEAIGGAQVAVEWMRANGTVQPGVGLGPFRLGMSAEAFRSFMRSDPIREDRGSTVVLITPTVWGWFEGDEGATQFLAHGEFEGTLAGGVGLGTPRSACGEPWDDMTAFRPDLNPFGHYLEFDEEDRVCTITVHPPRDLFVTGDTALFTGDEVDPL